MGLFDTHTTGSSSKKNVGLGYTVEASDYNLDFGSSAILDNDLNVGMLTIESLSNIAMSIQDTFESEIDGAALTGYGLGFESATAAIGLTGSAPLTGDVEYTVEKISETISKIWAKIVEVMKALFKSISQFFKGLFNQEKKLTFKLENMAAELKKNRSNYAASTDTKISNEVIARYRANNPSAVNGILDVNKAIADASTLIASVGTGKKGWWGANADKVFDKFVSEYDLKSWNSSEDGDTTEYYDNATGNDYMVLKVVTSGNPKDNPEDFSWKMSMVKNPDFDDSDLTDEMSVYTREEVISTADKLLKLLKSQSAESVTKKYDVAVKKLDKAVSTASKIGDPKENAIYQRLLGTTARSVLATIGTGVVKVRFKKMVAIGSMLSLSMKELKKAKSESKSK